MRELRVVGIDAEANRVICQDPETKERFSVPADERLRAAARGDLSRLGQIQIEMESSLRPREIQARIRGGASVAEVAAMAGAPVEKIERFAHPVLLERSRATELAALSHPLRDDGPTDATLGEIISDALTMLGYNPHDTEWDSWKGDDGHWVVQLTWNAGRTENLAHWRFIPGPHGGTAEPLDDLADELIHPEALTPVRRLTPVATPELTPIVDVSADGPEHVTVSADHIIIAQSTVHEPSLPFDDVIDSTGEEILDVEVQDTVTADTVTTHTSTADTPTEPSTTPAPQQSPEPEAAEPTEPAESTTETQQPAAQTEPESDPTPSPETSVKPGDKPRNRKRKPAVPAWEDVLLGVRSTGHN